MKITLSLEQKNELERLHRTTRDKRVCDRIKAVLLCSEGWSTAHIAQALRVHVSTIEDHINDYKTNEKLKPKNGGSQSFLSLADTNELIAHLTHKTYHHVSAILSHVKERYGISYSHAGMTKWLHTHQFSYKKPKPVPHRFDEAKQQQFIDNYQALKALQSEGETVLFIDAVHPTQATKISHGWIREREEKSIETTGSRTRLNIMGALNLADISNLIVEEYETINYESLNHFFTHLREVYPSETPLHIILDGAGYHHSNALKERAVELNISLHYLPPYSPNLNPIERLWKVMNEYVRNNIYFENKSVFRESIMDFFRITVPTITNKLITRLTDNFQILKSASSS